MVDTAGNIYTIDWWTFLTKYDASGKLIWRTGSQGTGPDQFDRADGLALGPDGNLYVADTWNQRVKKYDTDGNLLSIHHMGRALFDIAIDTLGYFYLAEHYYHRVGVYTPDLSSKITEIGGYIYINTITVDA